MSCENRPCDPCEKGCTPYLKGECLLYGGPTTDFLHIPNNLDYDSFVVGIDSFLAKLQAELDAITFDGIIETQNTNTITLNGNGKLIPLSASVKISTEPGNALVVDSTGLYVSSTGGAGITLITDYFEL